MRRCHKILLGILCGGVLLGGIGTGIAIGEFSALKYAGVKTLGETRMETRELEEEIDPEQGFWHINLACPGAFESVLVKDESVPENTVRFRVTYNAARVSPKLQAFVDTCTYQEEEEAYTQKQDPILELYCAWEEQDETELFMEMKDDFLKNLKEGKIASYEEPSYVEDVEVRINPANEDDIQFFW